MISNPIDELEAGSAWDRHVRDDQIGEGETISFLVSSVAFQVGRSVTWIGHVMKFDIGRLSGKGSLQEEDVMFVIFEVQNGFHRSSGCDRGVALVPRRMLKE